MATKARKNTRSKKKNNKRRRANVSQAKTDTRRTRRTRKTPKRKTKARVSDYSIKSYDDTHYENWFGRIREYRPVIRITDENVDRYIRKVLLDMPEKRAATYFSMFWELTFTVTRDGEEVDRGVTSVATTAKSYEDLIHSFRERVRQRLNEYKAKLYLRKSWVYTTTKTKTKRTSYEKQRPDIKVSKKKKRPTKVNKVRNVRHRGK